MHHRRLTPVSTHTTVHNDQETHMRKIIASTYTTLDGFIDDPHLWSLP